MKIEQLFITIPVNFEYAPELREQLMGKTFHNIADIKQTCNILYPEFEDEDIFIYNAEEFCNYLNWQESLTEEYFASIILIS